MPFPEAAADVGTVGMAAAAAAGGFANTSGAVHATGTSGAATAAGSAGAAGSNKREDRDWSGEAYHYQFTDHLGSTRFVAGTSWQWGEGDTYLETDTWLRPVNLTPYGSEISAGSPVRGEMFVDRQSGAAGSPVRGEMSPTDDRCRGSKRLAFRAGPGNMSPLTGLRAGFAGLRYRHAIPDGMGKQDVAVAQVNPEHATAESAGTAQELDPERAASAIAGTAEFCRPGQSGGCIRRRISLGGSAWSGEAYHYQITDHLGSTRFVAGTRWQWGAGGNCPETATWLYPVNLTPYGGELRDPSATPRIRWSCSTRFYSPANPGTWSQASTISAPVSIPTAGAAGSAPINLLSTACLENRGAGICSAFARQIRSTTTIRMVSRLINIRVGQDGKQFRSTAVKDPPLGKATFISNWMGSG